MTDPIDNDGVACRPQPTCPLCERTGETVHRGLRDVVFAAPGRWDLRRCVDPRCALIWLDPMPLAAETAKFYAGYYTHAGDGEPAPTATATAPGGGARRLAKLALGRLLFWRRHAFRSDLAYLEDLAPGRLLEVGCGSGAFLRQAAARGWRAMGIDFDAEAVAAARRTPGVDAAVGDLASMRFADASFDAVVLNNVIEHLPSPAAVVDECARVLAPGGRLVMVTPNARSLGYRRFGEDWRGLEVPRHLHLFSPGNLKSLARRAGLGDVSTFTTAGGGTGVQMVLFSQALRDRRTARPHRPDAAAARRAMRREQAAILLGLDVGEWAVLVAHREQA